MTDTMQQHHQSQDAFAPAVGGAPLPPSMSLSGFAGFGAAQQQQQQQQNNKAPAIAFDMTKRAGLTVPKDWTLSFPPQTILDRPLSVEEFTELLTVYDYKDKTSKMENDSGGSSAFVVPYKNCPMWKKGRGLRVQYGTTDEPLTITVLAKAKEKKDKAGNVTGPPPTRRNFVCGSVTDAIRACAKAEEQTTFAAIRRNSKPWYKEKQEMGEEGLRRTYRNWHSEAGYDEETERDYGESIFFKAECDSFKTGYIQLWDMIPGVGGKWIVVKNRDYLHESNLNNVPSIPLSELKNGRQVIVEVPKATASIIGDKFYPPMLASKIFFVNRTSDDDTGPIVMPGVELVDLTRQEAYAEFMPAPPADADASSSTQQQQQQQQTSAPPPPPAREFVDAAAAGVGAKRKRVDEDDNDDDDNNGDETGDDASTHGDATTTTVPMTVVGGAYGAPAPFRFADSTGQPPAKRAKHA